MFHEKSVLENSMSFMEERRAQVCYVKSVGDGTMDNDTVEGPG